MFDDDDLELEAEEEKFGSYDEFSSWLKNQIQTNRKDSTGKKFKPLTS